MLALHAAELGLVCSPPYGPPSPPEVILGHSIAGCGPQTKVYVKVEY